MNSTLSPSSTARRIIDQLVQEGVKTFFGIPGGPVCALFEAIRLHPEARLVLVQHEASAGMIAAAFHKASNEVPCIVVTSGPGITNSITGIANLYLERCPALVLAGDVSWQSSGRILAQDSGFQGIDTTHLMAPVTVYRDRLVTSNGALGKTRAALRASQVRSRRGPALLVIPLDVSYAECHDPDALTLKITHHEDREYKRMFDAQKEEIRDLLRNAQRPLVVVGHGARPETTAILEMIEALDVPFVTTPRAKGVMPETHPLSLRNGGMAASMWARRYTETPPDVCVVLGSDLDDTAVGTTKYVSEKTLLIHVDIDPSVFSRNFATYIALQQDIGEFCRDISHAMMCITVPKRVNRQLDYAKNVSPFDQPEPHKVASSSPALIRPDALMRDLAAEMKKNEKARVYTDIGEHMLFALHYLTSRGMVSTGDTPDFNIQLELGSMGSGICGAIGHALAHPEHHVICVTGDGCMQMYGSEVMTAHRERLNVTFIVFNDGRYNMVHHGMKQLFGEAEQYSQGSTDFAMWAASQGIHAAHIDGVGDLKAILQSFRVMRRKNPRPCVINVDVDPEVRIRGGGRVEALQQMSMSAVEAEKVLV